jgi:hypothetical protein
MLGQLTSPSSLCSLSNLSSAVSSTSTKSDSPSTHSLTVPTSTVSRVRTFLLSSRRVTDPRRGGQRQKCYHSHSRHPMESSWEPGTSSRTQSTIPTYVRTAYQPLALSHKKCSTLHSCKSPPLLYSSLSSRGSTYRSHPSIVYFHGNAATRAASNRIRVARYVSAQDTSLIIIDYRCALSFLTSLVYQSSNIFSGFGDSEGEPSEVGLKMDARTVWDYVVRTKGALPSSVGIMGQSLGTGVATALAASLASEGSSILHLPEVLVLIQDVLGTIPRALILVAPFSSIPSLLETYKLAGFIPVLAPFRPIPGVLNAFLNLVLKTKFDTLSLIQVSSTPCPTSRDSTDEV